MDARVGLADCGTPLLAVSCQLSVNATVPRARSKLSDPVDGGVSGHSRVLSMCVYLMADN
jgi:hypothetical protein